MKRDILFLCVGNSCRSQMAEGMMRHLFSDRFDVYSAGTWPTGHVHPMVVEVMQEVGIDISRQYSKAISELPLKNFDIVATVCDEAREACPIYPANQRFLHHSFPDPCRAGIISKSLLDEVRIVRDRIKSWLQKEFKE